MRGEQVALDALGDETQRVSTGLLLLAAQAAGDPRRKFGEIRRDQFDGDAGVGQRFQPGGLLLGPVETGQGDEQKCVGRRAGAVVLNGLSALAARLAGRDAQVDQLAAAEQRHVAGGEMQFVPVEAGNRRQHLALVETLPPGRGADGIGSFDDEQRFVAVNDVNRLQLAFEVGCELLTLEQHRRLTPVLPARSV